jgi:hypothetical protein
MNKKHYYVALVITLLLFSCTGLKTNSYGLENNGYIKIIGNKADYPYHSNLYMIIDNNTKVPVKVSKDTKKRPEGKIYKIKPGVHQIMIYQNGELLIDKSVFISSQEINKVYLP